MKLSDGGGAQHEEQNIEVLEVPKNNSSIAVCKIKVYIMNIN